MNCRAPQIGRSPLTSRCKMSPRIRVASVLILQHIRIRAGFEFGQSDKFVDGGPNTGFTCRVVVDGGMEGGFC
jgi:hypothetical protein